MIQLRTTTSNIDILGEMKLPTTILIYTFCYLFQWCQQGQCVSSVDATDVPGKCGTD